MSLAASIRPWDKMCFNNFAEKWFMNEDDDDEKLLDIDNETVPETIREHGRQFRKPARIVADLGDGEYILFAENGEVLDMVILQ